VLRRALRGEALLADESQGWLAFVETDVASKRYEYAVLVTDLTHELLTIANKVKVIRRFGIKQKAKSSRCTFSVRTI
jgi:hypothetical protein